MRVRAAYEFRSANDPRVAVWTAQPPQRQAMMTRAFRDLRTVPPDQRLSVLNSGRYKGAFSPEERSILADMLRVEPYQSARP